jgi:hypothetical protein
MSLSLAARLRRLEATGGTERRITLIFQSSCETQDEAVARHLAAKPDDSCATVRYIVCWGNSPDGLASKRSRQNFEHGLIVGPKSGHSRPSENG